MLFILYHLYSLLFIATIDRYANIHTLYIKRMSSITGVIVDIDGVLVGEKIGYNSPHPHAEVITALKKYQARGILISLCTAKPHFSITKIIEDSGLNSLHIADGGAVIINPMQNVIVQKHVLDKEVVTLVLEMCMENDIYTEMYTVDNYYVQESEQCDITAQHTHILEQEPVLVSDVLSHSQNCEVTKIMPIAKDEADAAQLPCLLLDVREAVQYQICALPHSLNIPLKDLTGKSNSDSQHKMAEVLHKASGRPICVICRRGVDSVTATHRLLQYVDGQATDSQDGAAGAKSNWQIYNVDGGLNEWHKLVDPGFPIY